MQITGHMVTHGGPGTTQSRHYGSRRYLQYLRYFPTRETFHNSQQNHGSLILGQQPQCFLNIAHDFTGGLGQTAGMVIAGMVKGCLYRPCTPPPPLAVPGVQQDAEDPRSRIRHAGKRICGSPGAQQGILYQIFGQRVTPAQASPKTQQRGGVGKDQGFELALLLPHALIIPPRQVPGLLLELAERGQYFFTMWIRLHLGVNLANRALRINQEGIAGGDGTIGRE